jgi:hypothetical protein
VVVIPENVIPDFAASATNGDMQVLASNGNCVSLPAKCKYCNASNIKQLYYY